jgi:predicted nucleic acid-binding protein
MIALDEPVLASARNLASKHALRALDAIQLACALRAVALLSEPMTFVSGDNTC